MAGALALLAATGVIAYRTFASRENLTLPTLPYPAAMTIIDDHPFTALRSAPLVVDGRLRVYAEQRRVWSDGPVGDRSETTPYWAYRRWPQELVGVIAVAEASRSLVVSQWSDGLLVALDARTGRIAWRASAPVGTSHYDGRRTGVAVIYEPRSLVSAGHVVLATASGRITAIAADTGRELWRRDTPGCEPQLWTGAGLVVQPACAGGGAELLDAATGTPAGALPDGAQPAACAIGRSECRVVRAEGRAWQLVAGGALEPMAPIPADALLAGGLELTETPIGVAARSLADGGPLWTYVGPGRLFAADDLGVYLITEDRTVIGLSAVTGVVASVGCASAKPDEEWRMGQTYTTGSFVALERLTGAPDSAADAQYYFGPRPVALVELYPPAMRPTWSNEWAACLGQTSGPIRR
jgi:hypothetical protein